MFGATTVSLRPVMLLMWGSLWWALRYDIATITIRVAAELPRFWRYIWCELEWSMRHSVSQIIVAFSNNYFKFWIDVTFFGYFIKRAAGKWSKFEASFSSLHEIVGWDCDHVRIDDRLRSGCMLRGVYDRLE